MKNKVLVDKLYNLRVVFNIREYFCQIFSKSLLSHKLCAPIVY